LRALAILAASGLSERARIWAASQAALRAPAESRATVATGKPGGIITVESRASMPPRAEAESGTPMTGLAVLAATAPARCAAMPAAQM